MPPRADRFDPIHGGSRNQSLNRMEETSSTVDQSNTAPTHGSYRIWASDNQVYGPVPLDTVVDWAKDSRVFPDTWVYSDEGRTWRKASAMAELMPFLPPGDDTLFLKRQGLSSTAVDPYELRLFPVFAALSNSDLAHCIRLTQLMVVEADEFIIRRGDPADSIFFILSGSVKARLMVGYDEKVLAEIPAGEFFGEIAMFTNTARTADIIAREQTRLLRFSAEAFKKLMAENPGAAAPLLYNISTTMAGRILETNNKLQNEVAGGFVWR